jgi:hypothetical protein
LFVYKKVALPTTSMYLQYFLCALLACFLGMYQDRQEENFRGGEKSVLARVQVM